MPLPPTIALIRRRLAAVGIALPGMLFSEDPDFVSGLIHVVAIEYDANAPGSAGAGGDNAGDGDRAEDWQPVHGLEAVACRLIIRRPKNIELGDRPSTMMEWKCMFGQSLSVDRRNRLVYRDDDDGSLRYGYLQGKVVNAHGMNHHWVASAYENPV